MEIFKLGNWNYAKALWWCTIYIQIGFDIPEDDGYYKEKVALKGPLLNDRWSVGWIKCEIALKGVIYSTLMMIVCSIKNF